MQQIKLALIVIRSNIYMIFLKLKYRKIKYKFLLIKDKTARINILKKGNLFIGSKVKINANSEIKCSKSIVLKNGVEIGNGTSIISTSTGDIEIGNNVFLNRNCIVVSCEHIKIGDGTAIGCNVTILDHDHYYVRDGVQPWNKVKTLPVIIGENVWIGANSIILSGTTIGDNAVIAAGSVVKGNIPSSKLMIQKRNTEFRDIQ